MSENQSQGPQDAQQHPIGHQEAGQTSSHSPRENDPGGQQADMKQAEEKRGAELASHKDQHAQDRAQRGSGGGQKGEGWDQNTGRHQGERAKRQEAEEKRRAEFSDRLAGFQGEFMNALDELGNSHETRMAKSHINQAMEWAHRHMHPDPSPDVPDAPPPAPPLAQQ